MIFGFRQTFRKNLWTFSPAELLASFLILLFFLMSLGACLGERPGADGAFLLCALYGCLWLSWMYFVALRHPAPFGLLGILRGLGPWLGLVFCYNLMRPLVPVLHPQLYDAALKSLDLGAMGRGPSLWEEGLKGRPLLTDLFCLFYLSLFVWLGSLLTYHIWLRRALYQRFMMGLILVYAGGFLGYLLYPAIGPRFAYPQDWTWLCGGLVFRFTDSVVDRLGSHFDVFPSLHGAISSYLLFWQLHYSRRSALWGVPLMLGIWASTLFLGYHYLPDLLSGCILGGLGAWAAPRLEAAMGAYRRSLDPPRVWLLSLTEGRGDHYGKLAGRLSEILPLGAETSPGFLSGGVTRNRSEAVLRQALSDLGGGPFWVRPSEPSGAKRQTLLALKPLSLEQVIRVLFTPKRGRFLIVQKALKVSAVGVCRSFPPRGPKLTDVEIKMTSLPKGDELLLRLTPDKDLFKGWVDTPWNYFPSTFPLKGFELFDVVTLTRKLAAKWGLLTEVEWVLSEGKVYVLDGRSVKGGNEG